MNLTKTFDTHIKAISTAKQWGKYKAMTRQPTLAELDKRYIEETLKTEWQRPRVIKINEDRPMKYKATTDKLGVPKGTTIKPSNDIVGSGIFLSPENEYVEAHPDFLEEFEQWFQPIEQVKGGQYWYIEYEYNEDVIKRIMKVDGNTAHHKEVSSGREDSCIVDAIVRNARKLSTHEIEEVLEKEAKRRGLVAGKRVKSACHQLEERLREDKAGYEYIEQHDMLYLDNTCLYQEGEFAEIVDQPIEINGKQIEVENGTVKISCGDTIAENVIIGFLHVVNKYDLKVHRGGECINEQLAKIAEHYE